MMVEDAGSVANGDAAPAPARRPRKSSAGKTFLSRWWVSVMVVGVLVLVALCLYSLWTFWPTAVPAGEEAPPSERVRFLWAHVSVNREVLLFVIVAVAGALGGLIHTLRSLSWYIGNRYLRWSWVPFYLLLPVVGAVLATVFYLVLRGGLFSGSTTTEEVNAYGFAALAALAGMFSGQATEKLRVVFTALFAETEAGDDHVDPSARPPIVAAAAATPLTAESATLTGSLDPAGKETTFWFEYGPTVGYGGSTEDQTLSAEAGVQTVSAEISDLDPATEYHFRLMARSSSGETPGTDQTFTTPDS